MVTNGLDIIVVVILIVVLILLFRTRKTNLTCQSVLMESFSVEKAVVAINEMISIVKKQNEIPIVVDDIGAHYQAHALLTLGRLNHLAHCAFPSTIFMPQFGYGRKAWMDTEMIEIGTGPVILLPGSLQFMVGLRLTCGLQEEWALTASGFMLIQPNMTHTPQSVVTLYDQITDHQGFFTGLQEKLESLHMRLEESQRVVKPVTATSAASG